MYTSTTRVVGNVIQPGLALLSAALTPAKPGPAPTAYPTSPPPPPPPPPPATLDAALATLADAGKVWAATDLKARAALFRQTMRTTREVGKERGRHGGGGGAPSLGETRPRPLVSLLPHPTLLLLPSLPPLPQAVLPAARAAVAAKGSYGCGAGEEMMGWLPVLWALREYADTLDGLSNSRTPPDVGAPFPRPDGKGLAVRTFPSRLDAILFGGLTGEVWLRPGVEEVVYGTPEARGEGGGGGGVVVTGELFFFGGVGRGALGGRRRRRGMGAVGFGSGGVATHTKESRARGRRGGGPLPSLNPPTPPGCAPIHPLTPSLRTLPLSSLPSSSPPFIPVLGAGNHLPVIATDILHALAAHGAPVLCKLNPVNAYVGPHLAAAFAPLLDAGLVALAYGGPAVGAAAVGDPRVGAVHLTGSAATFDAVVWGPRPAEAKAAGVRATPKPVTAELGCVSPVIVIPGPEPWTAADLAYTAAEAVAGLVVNAGHNCLKPEVVVVPSAWPQRGAFVAAVRAVLEATPRRCAYYPGSASKAAAFISVGGKGATEALGVRPPPGTPGVTRAAGAAGGDGAAGSADFDACPGGPILPWLLRAGLDPGAAATTVENWVGSLQEVGLAGPGDGGGPSSTPPWPLPTTGARAPCHAW